MGNPTTTGIKLRISTTRLTAPFDDLTPAGITAATTAVAGLTFKTVGNIENMGNLSDTASIETANVIDKLRPLKAKGNMNPGTVAYTIVSETTDEGQPEMEKAYKYTGSESYAFELEHPDGRKAYYSGLVAEWSENYGNTGAFLRFNANIERTSGTIKVAAPVVP